MEFKFKNFNYELTREIRNVEKEHKERLRDALLLHYNNKDNAKKFLEHQLKNPESLVLLLSLLSVAKNNASIENPAISSVVLRNYKDIIELGEYDGGNGYIIYNGDTDASMFELESNTEMIPAFKSISKEIDLVYKYLAEDMPLDDYFYLGMPIENPWKVNIIENSFEYVEDYSGIDVYYIEKIFYPVLLKIEEILTSAKTKVIKAIKDYCKEESLYN